MQIQSHLYDEDSMRIGLPRGLHLYINDLVPLLNDNDPAFKSRPSDEEHGDWTMAQAKSVEPEVEQRLTILDLFSRYSDYEHTAEMVNIVYLMSFRSSDESTMFACCIAYATSSKNG
jgi:hypothetical protein